MHSTATSSSSSSEAELNPLDPNAHDGWEDVEPDRETMSVVSLFDREAFGTVGAMLDHCRRRFNFDLVAVVKENGFDFYECVKLVNYIRAEASRGNLVPDVASRAFLRDDIYLQPVLEDDALLFSLDEVLDLAGQRDDAPAPIEQDSAMKKTAARLPHNYPDALTRISELEAQLCRSQSEFAEYREMAEATLDARWNADTAGTSTSTAAAAPRDDDSHYFASYAYNDIHEVMLKDTTRTNAYRDFIYGNKQLFAGKTVLDVGCGTGILSMFCAKAGAARVIAVDNSDIILKAREIIHENGLSGVVTCVRGKIEEVVLPVSRVDVIVSEWMGYCLLYEAMLESVLWARDRYLVPGGLMVPSFAVLQVAPVADPDFVADSIAYWHEVYGFRMSAMLERIHDDVLVRTIDPACVVTTRGVPFARLPLHTVTKEDVVHIKAGFDVELARDIDSLDAFAVWFDILFQTSPDEVVRDVDNIMEDWKKSHPAGVAFTTGPFGPETHWRSGMLLVNRGKKRAQPLRQGQKMHGTIEYKKRKSNSRELEIDMEWEVEGAEESGRQMWVMQ